MRARRSGAWTLPCGNADPGPGYQTAPGARWLVRSTLGYISWDLVARRSRPRPDTRPAARRSPLPASRAPQPAPRYEHLTPNSAGSYDRFGDSHFSASSMLTPSRWAYDSAWSRPMRPTLKYFARGCEKYRPLTLAAGSMAPLSVSRRPCRSASISLNSWKLPL